MVSEDIPAHRSLYGLMRLLHSGPQQPIGPIQPCGHTWLGHPPFFFIALTFRNWKNNPSLWILGKKISEDLATLGLHSSVVILGWNQQWLCQPHAIPTLYLCYFVHTFVCSLCCCSGWTKTVSLFHCGSRCLPHKHRRPGCGQLKRPALMHRLAPSLLPEQQRRFLLPLEIERADFQHTGE